MDTQELTVKNADLWSKYFREEWSRWLDPLGIAAGAPVAEIAEGTAARVAGFLTMVAAGPIAWLYAANAPQVSQIVDAGARELPLRLEDERREAAEQAA